MNRRCTLAGLTLAAYACHVMSTVDLASFLGSEALALRVSVTRASAHAT